MSDTPASVTSDFSSPQGTTPILPPNTTEIELQDVGSPQFDVSPTNPRASSSTVSKVNPDATPVERYDSESDHDDPTKKRKRNVKFWITITKTDIVLIFVALFLVCLGLAVGLIAFFLLQAGESQTAQYNLSLIASLNAAGVQKSLEDTARSCTALQAALIYANGTIDYYNQYLPFMNSSGLFTSRFTNLNYVQFVTDANRDSFEAAYKALGRDYANFQITTLNSNGAYVTSPRNPTYAVVSQTYPEGAPVLGYDVSSDTQKNETINTMLRTKAVAMSGKVAILSSNNNGAGAIIMAPVIANNAMQGFVLGAYVASAVISGSLDYTDTKNLVVAVVDTNSTSSNYNDILMTSTITDAQASTQFGAGTKAADVTPQMLQQMADSAVFTPVGVNINVLNRVWGVYFIPTAAYVNESASYQKWVALFVSIVGGIVLAGLIAFFTKRVQYAQYVRAITREQVQILESSQSKLHSLLNKIAVRERKTRGTIDAIPDMVFTINHLGRILQTNASFDKILSYGSGELEKGLLVDRVFPNLESMFFLKQHSIESLDSEAATKDGDRVKVQITVRNLMFSRKDKLSSTDSIATTNRDKDNSVETSVTSKDEIEAFVIVARNMTDREKLLEEMMKREQRYQERMKLVDFEAQFKIPSFRKQFKKHCRGLQNTEQASESLDLIAFLDVIQGYKKLPFEQRMNQQTSMYDTYISPAAPHRLTVVKQDENLASSVGLKITKSIGDADVFDEVEDAVKMRLVTEYYPAYAALHPTEESNSGSNTNTNSSDEVTTTNDTTHDTHTNNTLTSGEHTDR